MGLYDAPVLDDDSVVRSAVVKIGLPVLVVLAGLLAGCSGDDDDEAATTTTTGTESTAKAGELPERSPDEGDEAEADEPHAGVAVEPAACGPSNPTNQEDPDVLDREPPTPEPPPADTPPDALEASILIDGDGDAAAVNCGDEIVVHYTGVLSDGTVFDSSWERGDPFPVTIGVGEVIAGWDEGLIGARVGERRHLVIGSDLAYGSAGAGSDIPPNAPLVFDVDIVSITR